MSVKKNERRTAVNILLMIKTKEVNIADAIKSGLAKDEITDRRSKAFIVRIVFGTVENIIYIDKIIAGFSKKPVEKMNPKIAAILESAVYQMIFLDNVPISAICNESVKLAQIMGLSSLKGLVNGILRNVARNIDNIDDFAGIPDETKDLTAHLSLKYSIPEWIVKKWEGQFGDKTKSIIQALRKPSDSYIRCNTSLIDKDGLIRELEEEGLTVRLKDSWPDCALEISGIDGIEEINAFKAGHFYIQDISCIRSISRYPLKKGDTVLDTCASPGGKSIGAALELKKLGGGKVYSRDVSLNKTGRIRENVERMHLQDIIEIDVADATDTSSDIKYDVVISDVPCMGLGIIGRKPDILLNRKEEDVESIIKLQRQIVTASAAKVKKGGYFIYSTCSLLEEENEKQSRWIREKLLMKQEYEQLQVPGVNTEGTGFYTAIFKNETDKE